MTFSFDRAGLIDGSILSVALGSNAVDEMEIGIRPLFLRLLLMGREL